MSFDNPSPASTVDRVVQDLRRALFDGEIPPGTALREVALADQLGVARSTVREALAQLTAEGLAIRVPHTGTIVRSLDRTSIDDLCLAREILEGAGIEAWATAPEARRDDVRRALEAFRKTAARRPATDEVTTAHLAIHRSLVALTGSERVLIAADSVYAELRLALATVDRIRQNLDEQVASHDCLVGLLEAGDAAATRAELHDHLAGAHASLVSLLAEVADPDGETDGETDGEAAAEHIETDIPASH